MIHLHPPPKLHSQMPQSHSINLHGGPRLAEQSRHSGLGEGFREEHPPPPGWLKKSGGLSTYGCPGDNILYGR